MTFLSMTGCKRHAPCAAVVALLLLGMNGCASNVIGPDNNRAPEIRFYKHFQGSQDYPPRSAPAAITHDLEENLVKNGYYPVGDMEVYVSKNDQARSEEIFLHEAAARGADLVRPTGEAQKMRQEDTIVGERKVHSIVPTTVSQPYYYTANGPAIDPQHTQVGFKAGESYTESVYQKGAVLFHSTGTIWRRYDPQEVSRLPAGDRKAIEAWMQHPDDPWALAPAHFRDIRNGQDKSQLIAWFGETTEHFGIKVNGFVEMWMWYVHYPPKDGIEQPIGILNVCFDAKGKVAKSTFTVNSRTTFNDN